MYKAIYCTWYSFTNLSISRAITINKIKDGILKLLKAVNNETLVFKKLTQYSYVCVRVCVCVCVCVCVYVYIYIYIACRL